MAEQISNAEATTPNNGRKILLAIVGIPAVVLLFSTMLYYAANNKLLDLGTVNNGSLITPPVQISELALRHANGDAFDYSQPERKWSFVVIGGSDCNDSCERMLYISRQAHHALERRMTQIRRIYLNYDDGLSANLDVQMQGEYQTTEMLYVNKTELDDVLAGSAITDLAENRFYVVDPNGWLMMYYSAQDLQQTTLNDLGKKVIKDMKRIIK